MAHLEGAYEQTSQRLAAIDLRFDAIDRKIDERFMWAIGIVLGTWSTTIIAILVHH